MSASRSEQADRPAEQSVAALTDRLGLQAEDEQTLTDSLRGAARELTSFTSPLTVEVYMSVLVHNWREAMTPAADDAAEDGAVEDGAVEDGAAEGDAAEDGAAEGEAEPSTADTQRLMVELAARSPAEPGVSEAAVDLFARQSVTFVHALAAIAEPGPAEAARRLLEDPSLREADGPPEWAAQVGRARLRSCFTVDTEAGDETEVILTYAYDEDAAHALAVRISHSLAGMVTDVRAEADSEEVLKDRREAADADRRKHLAEADPADAHGLLDRAFAVTAEAENPPVTIGYRNLLAFALARVGALPAATPEAESPAWSEQDRQALIQDFAGSPEAEGLSVDAAEAVAAELVHYGAENDWGRPLRVSPTKLQVVCLGWLPRTGLLDARYVDRVADVLPAWARYAARRTGLSQAGLDETLEALPGITEQFPAVYTDPANWGPQRTAVERMLADIDPDTDDLEDAFARRMFVLGRLPEPEFDPGAEATLFEFVEQEHAGCNGADPAERSRLHREVARQLWSGAPPQTWVTAQRLLDEGMERHEILHALAFAVSGQNPGAEGDPATSYLSALDALPASWRDR